jgi:alkaline phosphatase
MLISHSESRRNFIKGAGLLGAASTIGTNQANAGVFASHDKSQQLKAKNVIFLVVDGMSSGTLGLAHHWSLRNRNEPLEWMRLFDRSDIRRALQDTASASSPVTDSAAASSAWGCGQCVNNGALNTDATGKRFTPIFSHAKRAGKATGLVTTCKVTHATPAGFAANVTNRNMEDEIARQYYEREIDVILGGGRDFFQHRVVPADKSTTVESRLTPVDRISDFQQKGYQFLQTKEDLATHAGSPRLLGLFSQKHMPFAIDRKNDPSLSHVPGLADMFKAALKSLGTAKNGFVLQVESGRVDHAGHANDPAAILHEQLDFDSCIPIALEFMKAHPDTLVIITTDHGTGGCQLNGAGKSYADSGPALDRINRYTASFEALAEHFGVTGVFDPIRFETATGIMTTKAQILEIQSEIDNKVKYLSSVMTKLMNKELLKDTAVGWTSNNHTAECVDLFAFGPGSQALPPFIQNYELFGVMTDALGLKV